MPAVTKAGAALPSLSSRGERIAFAAAAACLLAAYVLRNLTGIDARELWLDEASTYWLFAHSPGEIPRLAVEVHSQPPLYYWLMHALAGLGSSELMLRGWSWLAVLLLLVWLLFGPTRLGPAARLMAGLFLVAADFTLFLAQEMRPYALAALLTLPATVALLDLHADPSPRRALIYAALVLPLLYTLAFAAWVLAAHGLALAIATARRRAAMHWAWLVALVVGALYLPYLVSVYRAQAHVGDPSLATSLHEVVRPAIYAASFHVLGRVDSRDFGWLGAALLLTFAVVRRREPFTVGLVLLLVVGHIAFVHGFMKGRNPAAPRYLTPAFPVLVYACAIAVAEMLARLARRLTPRAAGVAPLALAGAGAAALAFAAWPGFAAYVQAPQPRGTWRALHADIAALGPGRKAVFFDTGYDGLTLAYQVRHAPDIEVLTDPRSGWDSAGAPVIDAGYVVRMIDARTDASCFLYQRDATSRERFERVFVPEMAARGFALRWQKAAPGHTSPMGRVAAYCR